MFQLIHFQLKLSTFDYLSILYMAPWCQEVCPQRIDLIHRHFRKMCRMLVDMDEWGQILMANLVG